MKFFNSKELSSFVKIAKGILKGILGIQGKINHNNFLK